MNYSIHALISATSILLPFGIGWTVRSSFNYAARLFWVYIIFLTLVQLGMIWMAGTRITNIWVLNLMIPIQSAWLLYLLYHWDKRTSVVSYILVGFLSIAIVWLISTVVMGGLQELNFIALSVQCVIISILCLMTLYGLTESQKGIVHQNERFWFILGLLLYFAGTSLFYTLGTVLVDDTTRPVWIIHSIMNICANLLYSWGFLCLSRQ
ncbi:MAG: hypothetical protein AAFP70_03780 [Calditrichota bacterium]